MAATTAKIGFGVLLKRSTTIIAELTDIVGPGYTRDTVEATHTESPNNYKEYLSGLMDAGEVTAELNFLSDATQEQLLTDLNSTTAVSYNIVFPTPSASKTCTFNAFVTAWQPSAPIQDVMKVNVTFKITGKPTWA